jgi:hypothetical protein
MSKDLLEELVTRLRECLLLPPAEADAAARQLLAVALEKAGECDKKSACWKADRRLPPCKPVRPDRGPALRDICGGEQA